MATTTANITLSSADLTGDALSLTQTSTLTKAGTATGLDQTSGVGRKTTTSNTIYTLFTAANYTADKAHKVYLRNTSSTATEFFTVTVNTQEIGEIYAGDWAFFPWTAATGADIKITPSVTATMTLEYMIIFE